MTRPPAQKPQPKSPKPSDRRVEKTKQALHQALMSLMAEKDYESISVSDITERANAGRSTFYAHYADKEDLLQESMQELRQFLLSGAVQPEAQDVHPALQFARPMLEHVTEVKDMFRALVGQPASAVRPQLQSMLSELVLERLRTNPPPSGVAPALAAEFIVGAFLAVTIHWVMSDGPEAAREIDAQFRRLVQPALCNRA